MIKYNSSNIIVGQIKEILSSFNLPYCKILNDGDKIQVVKNCTYIYNDMILLALVSHNFLATGFTYSENEFKLVSIYTEGMSLLNITHKLHMGNNYYDAKTHLGLGNYLRYKRDYNKLDLLPMYNCFSGQLATEVELKFITGYDTSVNPPKPIYAEFSTKASSDKLYVVPVKLWKSYDIYIECSGKVELVCGVYKNGNLVSKKSFADIYQSLAQDTYATMSNPRFNAPYTYNKLRNYSVLNIDPSTPSAKELIYRNEDNLCLFVKVPYYCNSSLVVIEHNREPKEKTYSDEVGSLENLTNITFDDNSNFTRVTRQIINWGDVVDRNDRLDYLQGFNDFITRSQLTKLNDKVQHPFADRLIEYIMKNTIDTRDVILNNTKLVQKAMITHNILTHYNQNYLWDNKLRSILYLLANEGDTTNITDKFYDIYGYVDKDIETNLPLLTNYDDIDELGA